MVRTGIAHTWELLNTRPADVARVYGPKSARYIQLAHPATRAQDYLQLEAWHVPAGSEGMRRPPDVVRALSSLTNGFHADTFVLVRSSHLRETSGGYTSPAVFIPKVDPARGIAAVQNILDQDDPDMGRLLVRVLGQPQTLREFVDRTAKDYRTTPRAVIGWGNLAFTAYSHHPLHQECCYFEIAHGLGSRIATDSGDAMLVLVERETGRIREFHHKAAGELLEHDGCERGVSAPEQYRQQQIDCIDVATERIAALPLFDSQDGFDVVDLDDAPDWWLINGALKLADQRDEVDLAEAAWSQHLGAIPFGDPAMPTSMARVLARLSQKCGLPIIVEGAWPHRHATQPYLFQLGPAPKLPRTDIAINIADPHWTSSQVLGVTDAELPLVILHARFNYDVNRALAALDQRFAAGGYILLAAMHDNGVIRMSPHCRVRCSDRVERLGSHAMHFMQERMAARPTDGYVLAMKTIALSYALPPPDETFGASLHLYHRARVQANGHAMACRVIEE